MSGGVASIATGAAESAASSISSALVQIAIQNFFNVPEGSAGTPVFHATKENLTVLRLFRESLSSLAPGLREVLPENNEDDKAPLPAQTSIWKRTYFRIPDLRLEPTTSGSLVDVIRPIEAKLLEYHQARFFWFEREDWNTVEPIKDHILLILFIINRVISMIGAYEQPLSPSEGKKLTQMLRNFIRRIIEEKLDSDANEDGSKRMSLAVLLSEASDGIQIDLKKLDARLSIASERTKYSEATKSAEQSLENMREQLYLYITQWLQADTTGQRRVSPKLLLGARTEFTKYRTYSDMNKVKPGHAGGGYVRFCETKGSHAQSLFLLLKVLHAQIDLDPATAGQEIEKRIATSLDALKDTLDGLPPHFTGTLTQYVKAQMIEIFQTIPTAPLALTRLFNETETRALSEHLFSFITLYHYIGVVQKLIAEMNTLGQLVGNLAGALLPMVTKAIVGVLEQVYTAANQIESAIAKIKSDDKFNYPILADLRSAHAAIHEHLAPALDLLQTAISSLSSMISVAYDEELRAGINAQVSRIHSLLGSLLGPEELKRLSPSLINFVTGIDGLLPGASISETAAPPIASPTRDEARAEALKKIINSAIDLYRHDGATEEKIGGPHKATTSAKCCSPAENTGHFANFVTWDDHQNRFIYNDAITLDRESAKSRLAATLLACYPPQWLHFSHRALDSLKAAFSEFVVNTEQQAAIKGQFDKFKASATTGTADSLAEALLTSVENSSAYSAILNRETAGVSTKIETVPFAAAAAPPKAAGAAASLEH